MQPATISEPDLYATRQTLLTRLRNLGDDASWQECFDLYWRLIHSVALNTGLAEVEAQETFIALSQTMSELTYRPEKCRFRSFLQHLARRKIADQLRQRGRRRLEDSASELGAYAPAPPPVEERPDPASLTPDAVWDSEFERGLFETALEKVKAKVNATQL